MRKRSIVIVLVLLLGVVLFLTLSPDPVKENEKKNPLSEIEPDKAENKTREWIIAWEGKYDPKIEDQSEIITWDEEQKVTLVLVDENVDQTMWEQKWKSAKGVRYLQPNYTYKVKILPNDTFIAKQNYLNKIKAEQAWNIIKENTRITIAVIDTGVDLTHPDLHNNLVNGVNMLDEPGTVTPPQDDNGHGTQVAGILAAEGNNSIGISGILWKAKIMPIKAMDAKGEGKDYIVGRSIYEAVERDAKIILLSLGDPIYSQYMKEAVEYAEKKGVLVVAATGNDYERVNYPAAFPTVLAVGAVNNEDMYMNYSNSGPEVNISAPGEGIYTTSLEGQYIVVSGTSMAAPQVAGLAALVLAKYPDMTPAQVRDHIFQTAVDVSDKGWDSKTGFGRIDLERALKEAPAKDFMEPNNAVPEAIPFPVNTERRSMLSGPQDKDWYRIDAPYSGTFALNLSLQKGSVTLSYFKGSLDNKIVHTVSSNKDILLTVPKGTSYILIENAVADSTETIHYELNNNYVITQDAYEDNDKRWKAATLPYVSKAYTGNFHDNDDEDWFVLDVPRAGNITIKVSVETTRIDPFLTVYSPSGDVIEQDEGSRGDTETISLKVEPGKLFIHVTNYYEFFVNGQYELDVEIGEEPDPNEPNNEPTKAQLLDDKLKQGNLGTEDDLDWFMFHLHEDELVQLTLTGLPESLNARMILYDEALDVVNVIKNESSSIKYAGRLASGKYYVRIDGEEFQQGLYGLTFKSIPLEEFFLDIKDHWAKDTILYYAGRQTISGYGDFTFRPDKPISRAEVAAILAKAMNLPQREYGDVLSDVSSHWARNAIGIVVESGYLNLYPDGQFQPDHLMTRAEAAALFNVLLENTNMNQKKTFSDVPVKYWAYQPITNVVSHNIMSGYVDGTFRPKQAVTRAELLTILRKWEESRQQ